MADLLPVYPVSREHLEALSTDIAILRSAVGSAPDARDGYRTDDVARALRVDMLHAQTLGWPAVSSRAWRNLRFLSAAFDASTGRFRDGRSVDRAWSEGPGSDLTQGLVMLTLGKAVGSAPDPRLAAAAAALFHRALPVARTVTDLRALSGVLLGCERAMHGAPSERTTEAARSIAAQLRLAFGALEPGWPTPQTTLTTLISLPASALIVGGELVGSRPMVDAGLRLLDWLIVEQVSPSGHLAPIGHHGWTRGGERPPFDQRPSEATGLLLCAESAYRATGQARYRSTMELAYAWFLGQNDHEIHLATPARGASCNGLTPTGLDLDQGAEATLMWNLALEHIRLLREPGPRPRPAG